MALVVAVPVALILLILVAMPRGGEYPLEFSRATQPFDRSGFEHKQRGGGGAAAAAVAAGEQYAVVVDAGSTGSRVHVFKFLAGKGGALELQFDKFEQLRPGLSSYADDPPAAAKSLKPLLDLAMATVPKALQPSTHVMVGATAGLRLLPDGKADVILDEVRRQEVAPCMRVWLLSLEGTGGLCACWRSGGAREWRRCGWRGLQRSR